MVTLMLLLIWFISWTPYAMVFFLTATGYKHWITPHVDMLPGITVYIQTIIDT